jgi:hypothetical protein
MLNQNRPPGLPTKMYNSNFWRAAKFQIRMARNTIKLERKKLSLRADYP